MSPLLTGSGYAGMVARRPVAAMWTAVALAVVLASPAETRRFSALLAPCSVLVDTEKLRSYG